jgi:hypothetical protein
MADEPGLMPESLPAKDAAAGNGQGVEPADLEGQAGQSAPSTNGAAAKADKAQVVGGAKFDESDREDAEKQLNTLLSTRARILASGVPLFLLLLASLAKYSAQIFSVIDPGVLSPLGRFLTLWVIAIGIAGSFYYFSFHVRVKDARNRLSNIEETLLVARLSSTHGRLSYYRERLFRLTAKTARVFFDETPRQEQASRWRRMAGDALDEVSASASTAGLSDVETYLNSLDELINREEREIKEQRLWQVTAVLIIIMYITGLGVAVFFTNAALSDRPTPIFHVPLSVIMWGAAGSLAAILYRFYTEQGRIRFASEIRWLIARPMIGIIMGAVVYLALASGLVILGNAPAANAATPPTEIPVQAGRLEVFWVIAFLAGFSDKFYLGVIDLLVARTVKSEEVGPHKIIQEKERIPAANDGEEEPKDTGVAKGDKESG